MKITQLRGDLAAFRNLELSIVLNAMKTENSRKPVTTLRQNIPYLTPGIKSLAAEKIPVVLFGVTLKRDDERIGVATYAGLVLLSIGNLIDYAEAAAIRDRAAGFPQTLASFVGSSGRSVKIVVPFTLSDAANDGKAYAPFSRPCLPSCRTLLRSTAPVARRMERRRMPDAGTRMPCVV